MATRILFPDKPGYYWAKEKGDEVDVDVMLIFILSDMKTAIFADTKWDVNDFEWFEFFDSGTRPV